jgi:hypothetical protein
MWMTSLPDGPNTATSAIPGYKYKYIHNTQSSWTLKFSFTARGRVVQSLGLNGVHIKLDTVSLWLTATGSPTQWLTPFEKCRGILCVFRLWMSREWRGWLPQFQFWRGSDNVNENMFMLMQIAGPGSLFFSVLLRCSILGRCYFAELGSSYHKMQLL